MMSVKTWSGFYQMYLQDDFKSNHWSQGLLPPAGRTERTQERHSCKRNTVLSLRVSLSSHEATVHTEHHFNG